MELTGCSYCYTADELEVLAGDPALAPDDLVGEFAREPSDHWELEEWRWLWRRYAHRVIAMVGAQAVDVGLTLQSLGRHSADLSSWPDDERRAVDDALGSVLAYALGRWSTYDLVQLLGGLACVYDDLRPWLARLDGPAGEVGVVHLALRWTTDLLWEDHDWFTWWFTDDPVTPVREWVDGARPRVERFAAANPGCKTARDALIAYDHLDQGLPNPWSYPGAGWDRWQRMGLPGSYGWLTPSTGSG
ncbi:MULTISPECIES: hypothetical protein [Saccharothrix]|uniref:hypothetical protein n=1 Tax=Saccharothrix TaxID=2071 RepID=UPI0009392394|nr:hypothetical protein [Saccharothrix sp. CB00851]OKI24913.1 hypothetical protein A6A25_33460 [Saccharothrix sp. CB00851]